MILSYSDSLSLRFVSTQDFFTFWCPAALYVLLPFRNGVRKVHVFQEGHKNNKIFTVELTLTK